MKVPNPGAFRSGRDFAAWLGLTPKDHSTAGKTRLGVITRAGDEALRRTLVVGATAVIQQIRRGRGRASPWLTALIARKPPKLAAVALANKTARIVWKLMVSGERYDHGRAASGEGGAERCAHEGFALRSALAAKRWEVDVAATVRRAMKPLRRQVGNLPVGKAGSLLETEQLA